MAAEGNPGPDTIEFNMTFPAAIALACPFPTITESLAIAGPGPDKLTINVDDPAVFNTSQIFDINARSKAKEGYDISSLTLDGSLVRDNVDLLRGNRATGNSYDKLTVGYVLFTALGGENSNSLNNKGGGIYYTSMTLTVKQSAFYKIRITTAGAEGVAIYSLSSWALQIYATRFEKMLAEPGRRSSHLTHMNLVNHIFEPRHSLKI